MHRIAKLGRRICSVGLRQHNICAILAVCWYARCGVSLRYMPHEIVVFVSYAENTTARWRLVLFVINSKTNYLKLYIRSGKTFRHMPYAWDLPERYTDQLDAQHDYHCKLNIRSRKTFFPYAIMREAVQSATRIKLDVQLNYYFKLNFFLVAGRFCHMPQCGMHSIALHVFEYKLDVQRNYHYKLNIRSSKTFRHKPQCGRHSIALHV